MHKKRNNMPKTWPLPRKNGPRYLAMPDHSDSEGIPLLFVLRDILKIAKTRKEARYIALNRGVKINNKIRKSEMFPLQIFDRINLEKTGKNYRLNIMNRKFVLEEIPQKDAGKKIVKIAGKKILPGNRTQINLEDGQNFLTKEEFSTGDSAVVNFTENKIGKILKLEKNAKIEIISGKHAGERGKLEEIVSVKKGKKFKIKLEKGKVVDLPLKTFLVIE